MLVQIAVGIGLVIVTTFIQGVFMMTGIRALEWRRERYGRFRRLLNALHVSCFTAWMLVGIAFVPLATDLTAA